MKPEYNVIITSLNPGTHFLTSPQYYYCTKEYGEAEYCTAFSNQEAGVKSILSRTKIDGIVVVGSKGSCPDELVGKRISVKNDGTLYKSSIDHSSIFEQFAYRISEYLNGFDLELSDCLSSITDDEREYIDEALGKLTNYLGKMCHDNNKSRMFHYLMECENTASTKTINFLNDSNGDYIKVMALLYDMFDDYYKMKPLMCNDNLVIQFARINNGKNDDSSISNIISAMKKLYYDWSDDIDCVMNVYLDTQGLNQADALALYQTYLILANQDPDLVIKQCMSANPYYTFFVRRIDDSNRSVELSDLSNGVNEFINYGKTDLLVKYWNSRSINDPYIMEFIYAMKLVDIGISLCRFSDLEKGIKTMKRLIKQGYSSSDEDFDSGLFELLMFGIINDYGPLLMGNDDNVDVFELIKWVYKKKYYQQAITFIESKIPDDMVARGIWYYADNDDEAKNVLNMLADEYNNTASQNRYSFNEVDHYMVKFEGRWKMSKIQSNDDKSVKYTKYKISLLHSNESNPYQAHTVIDDENAIYNALLAYYVASEKRNEINHASSNASKIEELFASNGESLIYNEIKETIDYFIDNYTKVVELAKEKTHYTARITTSDIISLAKEKKYNTKKEPFI